METFATDADRKVWAILLMLLSVVVAGTAWRQVVVRQAQESDRASVVVSGTQAAAAHFRATGIEVDDEEDSDAVVEGVIARLETPGDR